MTESSAINLNKLPTAKQEELLELLFGSGPSSARLSAMKATMLSNDFAAAAPWSTYDDRSGDVALANFSVARDLLPTGSLTLIRRALAAGFDGTIQAYMDFPPDWMLLGALKPGNSSATVDPVYYDVLARYYAKYVQAYASHGVHIDFIEAFNEPTDSYTLMSATQLALFLGFHLGPTFERLGLHPKTQLTYGGQATRASALDFVPAVMADPAAAKYMDLIAYHGCTLAPPPPFPRSAHRSGRQPHMLSQYSPSQPRCQPETPKPRWPNGPIVIPLASLCPGASASRKRKDLSLHLSLRTSLSTDDCQFEDDGSCDDARQRYDAIATLHARYPSKKLWLTEICYAYNGNDPNCTHASTMKECVDYPRDPNLAPPLPRTDFADGATWGHRLVRELQSGASGWIYWNLLLDASGGPFLLSPKHNDAADNLQHPLVIVDAAKGTFEPTGLFRFLTHFSRFVRPGSSRVRSTESGLPSGVSAVAFAVPSDTKAKAIDEGTGGGARPPPMSDGEQQARRNSARSAVVNLVNRDTEARRVTLCRRERSAEGQSRGAEEGAKTWVAELLLPGTSITTARWAM